MKKQFYHILFASCASAMLLYLPSCKKAEDIQVFSPKPEKELVGFTGGSNNTNRLKIVHLYKDTVYTLSQNFTREAGEELVIDEGTLVKVITTGSVPNITINPGGSIIANGTRENPIVFTSNAPTSTQNRNWGGIIIQGKSINNQSRPNGDRTDFSGSLTYVRIEFASLVLNSVGNRSIVENVQVSYANPQSSFEINGGTFNARNLVSYACSGPADFYFSNGYYGKMQNVLAYRHPFFGNFGTNPVNALCGVFIENNPFNPVNARPYTYPVISNLTVLGPNAQNGSTSIYGDTTLRSAALVTTNTGAFLIRNSIFLGYPASCWTIDDSLTAYGVHYNYSAVTHSIFQCDHHDRTFYLHPGSYPPFEFPEQGFRNFMFQPRFENREFTSAADFMLDDPFNYEGPKLLPKEGSPVFTGANFDRTDFSDPFFEKVNYVGATGSVDWLKGWTNFTPLKTSYNTPG